MTKRITLCLAALLGASAGLLSAGAARADVTIQEQSSFDFSIIKAHGTTAELIGTDKERRDSVLHCEGFMSLLCGNAQSGEIVRLDRELTWMLEPKKQAYREITFAQAQTALRDAQASLDKMRQCPAAKQTAPGPDTEKCQRSPPKFDLVQTDVHASLIGHDARLTQMTLTESCTNPDTGDSCDFQIAMDAWLTQDQIAGIEERRGFQKAYLHKMGLDDSNALVQPQLRRFLAPYQEGIKQLAAKAGDFKGYPLKTSVRMAFGGPHCAAAQKSQDSNGDSSASGGAGLGAVASNLGSKLGGLFKKKGDAAPDASSAASAPASPPPPGMIQAAQFTVETLSITPGAIDPSQFEIPAGWKLVTPEPRKAEQTSCPGG
jgi:hypothetical protein